MTLAAKEYAKAAEEQVKIDQFIKENPSNDFSYTSTEGDIISGSYDVNKDPRLIRMQAARDGAKSLGDQYISIIEDITKKESKLLYNSDLNTGNTGIDARLGALRNLQDKEIEAGQQMGQFWRENQAEVYRILAESDKEGYTARLTSLIMFLNSQKQLLEQSRENQIEKLITDTMNETGLSREEAEKRLANSIVLINAKTMADVIKIDQDGTKIREDIDADYTQKLIDNIAKRAEAQAGVSIADESGELAALAQEYAKGEMAAKVYEAKKTEITRLYAAERFDAELVMLMEQLELLGLTSDQRDALEKKIAENALKYRQWLNTQTISDAEKTAKLEQEIAEKLAQKKMELFQDTFVLATTLMSAHTENELNELEKREEQADKADEEEKDRIDRLEESGAISKEESDARKAAIDDQAATREEEMERKKIELRRKQATFEKAVAITQIAIDTAVAVGKIKLATGIGIAGAIAASPLTGGLPWSAIIAASGATQVAMAIASGFIAAATAAAKPLPQYAEGTENHPGGLAMVGDGGKSEAVIYGGKVWKTPARPTVVDLPKGAQVMPDFRHMFLDNYTHPQLIGVDDDKGVTVVVNTKTLENDQKKGNLLLKRIEKRLNKSLEKEHYNQISTNKNRSRV